MTAPDPDPDPAPGPGRPMSDARISGRVAAVVLVLIFAFVGWFVWLAG